jgi:DNA polymerase-1
MEGNTLTVEIPHYADLFDKRASRYYLLDGDYALYLALGSTTEQCEWDDGVVTPVADLGAAVRFLESWFSGMVDPEGQVVFAFSEGSNYRIKWVPTYKAHRTGAKPVGYYQLRKRLQARWSSVMVPWLEADDLIGIYATCPAVAEKLVILAEDKDFLTIPAARFNPRTRVITLPTPESARYALAKQVLMGDSTDGYKGIPGVGPKTADKLLAGLSDPLAAVPEIYGAHGVQDWSDNLLCARILSWPWVRQEVSRWYVDLTERTLRTIEGCST